jgi:hypothetical protein
MVAGLLVAGAVAAGVAGVAAAGLGVAAAHRIGQAYGMTVEQMHEKQRYADYQNQHAYYQQSAGSNHHHHHRYYYQPSGYHQSGYPYGYR